MLKSRFLVASITSLTLAGVGVRSIGAGEERRPGVGATPIRPGVGRLLEGLGREPRHGVLVIAHRGYSGRYPENTLLAFRKAIEVEADMVELDVTRTRDGRVVVIHDDTLDRTTDGSGPVQEHTIEEIRRLEAGRWFSREFAGEPVPTLLEVLEMVRGRIGLNIEIKPEAVTDEERGGIEEACVTMVRAHRMERQVLFSSFSARAVARLRRLAPDIPSALLDHRPDEHDPVALARSLDASALHVNARKLRPETVEAAHRAGMPLLVYTLNDAPEYREAIRAGVAGIFTDYPEKLQHFLQEEAASRR